MKWVTGGTEALHQLVDAINRMGGKAFIVYYDQFNNLRNCYVPLKFKHYNIKSTVKVEDSEQNAVVIPESRHELLNLFSKCKRYLWWLGWFHFQGNIAKIDRDVVHLYQSEYLRLKLLENKVQTIKSLSDYIKVPKNRNRRVRKDVIAIPARKIAPEYQELHKVIINNFNVLVIRNWSLFKLRRKVSKSKLYVDFGIHAGKDRLPRETAYYRNIVYTSTLGTCDNQRDVPINKKYKISSCMDFEELKFLIKKSLDLYNTEVHNQKNYQTEIEDQKQLFFNEVSTLFGTNRQVKSINRSIKIRFIYILEICLVPLGLYQYQFPYKPWCSNKVINRCRLKLLDLIQIIIK